MFDSVLIPINLSEEPEEVLSLVEFLRHFDTKIVYLCNVSSSAARIERHGRKKLEELAAACRGTGIEIRTEIRSGPPAVEIIHASENLEVEFITFPWERKSILLHALMGSITRDVVRLSEKPVFIYKQWFLKKSDVLDTVIFSTDFSPVEDAMLPYLTYPGLAADNLVMLHVGDRAPDPKAENRRHDRIDMKMNEVIYQCTGVFTNIEKRILTGKPARVIPRQVVRAGADLIITGKHSDGSARQKVLGTTAENIVHRARCSVLVIPDEG